MTDCPKCGYPLDIVYARDGADDQGEVVDAYCTSCGWEDVDPELGEAVVEP